MSDNQNKTALIRRCDGCGRITGINRNNTPENKRDMQRIGQTVLEQTEEDALELWGEFSGACVCEKHKPPNQNKIEEKIKEFVEFYVKQETEAIIKKAQNELLARIPEILSRVAFEYTTTYNQQFQSDDVLIHLRISKEAK